MIDLCEWYDQNISIQVIGDERVFRTLITWVTDLPEKEIVVEDKAFQLQLSPELENISDVFIYHRLPEYFQSTFQRCILLNALTGEWFYVKGRNRRVPILVNVIPERCRGLPRE